MQLMQFGKLYFLVLALRCVAEQLILAALAGSVVDHTAGSGQRLITLFREQLARRLGAVHRRHPQMRPVLCVIGREDDMLAVAGQVIA